MSDDLKERLRSCAEEYRSEQINICLEAAGRIEQLENEVHVLSGAAQWDISAHNKLADRNKQLERDLAEANVREANDYNELLDERNQLAVENVRSANRIAELEAMVAAQEQEPVYQIESTMRDGLFWRDTNKETYDTHFITHRRKLFAAPPAPARLSLVKSALEAAAKKSVDTYCGETIRADAALRIADAIRAIDPQDIINEVSK